MLELLFALLCLLAVGYLVLLLKSYGVLSVSELKRQARLGDRDAKAVYGVRGVYGTRVFIVLWALIGIFGSLTIVLLQSKLWGIFVVLLSTLLTVLVGVLPWFKLVEPNLRMASVTVPVFRRILAVVSPLLSPLYRIAGKWFMEAGISNVHSKEELLEVLARTQIDGSPFSRDELSIAVHALTFGDRKITEIMTPRSVVKYVRFDDILSPVLLGELHESGFSRFPVIESERGSYVGVLYSKDLSDLKANRSVREVMRPELYYVNEFSSLDNVLNAFLRTQHHLFLVVNEFEEVVGIVTIEDIVEQIIGRKIVDEFDQYADLRAVAKQLAQKEAAHRHGENI